MAEQPLLQALDRLIINNRGAVYEADVFSVLFHNPYVVRSFEFAMVDGTLDCTMGYGDMSYAERFFKVEDRAMRDSTQCELLHFDVKSTVSPQAGSQSFIHAANQSRYAAFFIGVCATDSSFVELTPILDSRFPGPMTGL